MKLLTFLGLSLYYGGDPGRACPKISTMVIASFHLSVRTSIPRVSSSRSISVMLQHYEPDSARERLSNQHLAYQEPCSVAPIAYHQRLQEARRAKKIKEFQTKKYVSTSHTSQCNTNQSIDRVLVSTAAHASFLTVLLFVGR
jgi:hypothetical protein